VGGIAKNRRRLGNLSSPADGRSVKLLLIPNVTIGIDEATRPIDRFSSRRYSFFAALVMLEMALQI
jgi:hypothetical protein